MDLEVEFLLYLKKEKKKKKGGGVGGAEIKGIFYYQLK